MEVTYLLQNICEQGDSQSLSLALCLFVVKGAQVRVKMGKAFYQAMQPITSGLERYFCLFPATFVKVREQTHYTVQMQSLHEPL